MRHIFLQPSDHSSLFTWFENNRSLILLWLIPLSLLFTTGSNQFLFTILFYIGPLLLSLMLIGRPQPFTRTFNILIGLWLLSFVFQIVGGFYGASLGKTVLASMENLGIVTWMMVFYQYLQKSEEKNECRMSNVKIKSKFETKNANFSSPVLNLKSQISTPVCHSSFVIRHSDFLFFLFNTLTACAVLLSLLSFYILLPGVPKPTSGFNLIYAVHGHNHIASFLLFVLPYLLVKWLNGTTDNVQLTTDGKTVNTRTEEQRNKETKKQNYPQQLNNASSQYSTFFIRFARRSVLAKAGHSAIVLFFLLLTFFLSFARSAFMALPFITVPLLWLYNPQGFKKFLLWFLSVMPIFLIILIWILPTLMKVIPLPTTNQLPPTNSSRPPWLLRQIYKPLVSEGRLDYWQVAWRAFQYRPVFGNGVGTFSMLNLRWRDNPNSETNYAHNIWLEKLSEEGVIGTVLYLGMIILVGKKLISRITGTGKRISTNEDTFNGNSRSFAQDSFRFAKRHSSFNIRHSTSYLLPLILAITAAFVQSHFDVNFNFLSLKLIFWLMITFLFVEIDSQMSHVSNLTSQISNWVFTPLAYLLPTLLFVFGLLFSTSIYFTIQASQAETRGNKTIAAHYYQKATKIFPFEEKYWEKWLKLSFLRSDTTNQITQWYLESPLLLNTLANKLVLTDENSSIQWYKRAIVLDPFEYSSYLELAKIAQKEKDWNEMVDNLTQGSVQKLRMEPLSINPVETLRAPSTNTEPLLIQYLSSVQLNTIDWGLITPFFYLIGLNLIEQDKPKEALPFWIIIAEINPSWSHPSIELASLYNALNDKVALKNTLKRCTNDRYARAHCLQAYEWLQTDRFPPPGSLKDEIIEF